MEREKQDRLSKAAQRVNFLEQKVLEEDALADNVQKLESSAVGNSGLYASRGAPQRVSRYSANMSAD